MTIPDLRAFIDQLEALGELKRIACMIDPQLEITEICDRVLRTGGPALLFEQPKGHSVPVLANLFGTPRRVALGMGLEASADPLTALREVGRCLAALKTPEPPDSLKAAWQQFPLLRRALDMVPKTLSSSPCQEIVREGSAVDLSALPIQTCWPDDVAPLVTWGLTVTRGTRKKRQNLGIYRQQLLGPNKLIMRWMAHRGGALDYAEHCQDRPGEPFPLAVVIGCDPATLLAAVTPIPDTLSEYQFAGLLRGARSELARCLGCDLQVPARAEIVLEGYIHPEETAMEGPFGDHTGYYNEPAEYPVFTVERMTSRRNPVYLSTHTGKPPDEPAVLGLALNEVFVPLLQQQFPEITDFYLPPEGCSYRLAVVSIRKQYPGHARRIMFGIWSYLRQFTYTKFIIVTDDDIAIRDWKEVVWAMTTRVDACRDTTLVDHTPIDCLDFASPTSGLGSKMGIDATRKWPEESSRIWGRPIVHDEAVRQRIDDIWDKLGL